MHKPNLGFCTSLQAIYKPENLASTFFSPKDIVRETRHTDTGYKTEGPETPSGRMSAGIFERELKHYGSLLPEMWICATWGWIDKVHSLLHLCSFTQS